jgi:hypothetical protein
MDASGWIGVKDRLPPNAEHVLIVTKQWRYAHHAIRCEGRWDDLSLGLHFSDDEDQVTHWMPMPARPDVPQPCTPDAE